MSLLIKALDKAQSAKQNPNSSEPTNADLELSLSPASSKNSKANQSSTQSTQAKSAANVFAAKGFEPVPDNKNSAVMLGLGLLALLGLGAYYYVQLTNIPEVNPSLPVAHTALQAPPAVEAPMSEPPAPPAPQALVAENSVTTAPAPLADESVGLASPVDSAEPAEMLQAADMPEPQAFKLKALKQLADNKKQSNKKALKETAADDDVDEVSTAENVAANTPESMTESTLDANEQVVTPSKLVPRNKSAKVKKNLAGKVIASESASIEVSKSQPLANINPTLMSAYEAYNAGNDSKAQALYKQVLRSDVRNVDALLGLGAIAQRQGRAADANGWYGKVLEVEPRNTIAQTAVLDTRAQGNPQADETRIKNMLAKQPDDANLHAALGSLYADQNQWPAAQQAYFDAYRLHASAVNAFNLAVSLDQMGKPKLALPYYQRALEQAHQSEGNIDKAALEARIRAIR